jgi:L-rhamnose-H+ transport protein
MNFESIQGLLLVCLSGVMAGFMIVPMKYASRWKWENVWLAFCFVALFLAPVLTMMIRFPSVVNVYGNLNSSNLVTVVCLGFGWGIGCALAGIGYAMLGVGLGMTLNLGLTTAFGSLLPFVVLFPDRLLSPSAIALYAAILLVVIGLALSARAGTVRESAQNTAKNVAVADLATFARGNLHKGLVICIAAGMFSSMYNLALSFGQGIRLAALSAGARPADAVNALWLPVEIAAFAANLGYCGYLLSKNSTWALYVAPRSFGHWMLAVLMGLLWVTSISVYGLGAAHLGTMGPILGFPVNMAMTIVAANVAGVITGEWAGSPRRALLFLRSGALMLIAAMVVIGVWQANSR